MGNWIRTKDKKPEVGKIYLGIGKVGLVFFMLTPCDFLMPITCMAYVSRRYYYDGLVFTVNEITHYMELPEIPEELKIDSFNELD